MSDKTSGKAKEAYGAIIGDEDRKAEGKAEQRWADADAKKKAKEKEKAAERAEREARAKDNPLGKLLGG
jgi:uncharacterized protein YjbJ (UPF0337 family)